MKNYNEATTDGISGCLVVTDKSFRAWQPSTWPTPPKVYNDEFRDVLSKIFHDSLLVEIDNVITDAPTLERRGHVVALSIMCAIDAISSYAFRLSSEKCSSCGRGDKVGPRYIKYIETFFPEDYRVYARAIYKTYRNSLTHSWNLFQGAMLPGDEPIKKENGLIVFGLKHLFGAFKKSVDRFLENLSVNESLQLVALQRYCELRTST